MHPSEYAIIETGGKQYKVSVGNEIDVELLHAANAAESKAFQFDKVLFVTDGTTPRIGQPYLDKCAVHAELIGQVKGPKVVAFKYKRCKNYRRTVGHRQKYSRVKIIKIAVA